MPYDEDITTAARKGDLEGSTPPPNIRRNPPAPRYQNFDDDDGDLGGGITMSFGPESPPDSGTPKDEPLESPTPQRNNPPPRPHTPKSNGDASPSPSHRRVQSSTHALGTIAKVPGSTSPSSHRRAQSSMNVNASDTHESGDLDRQEVDSVASRHVSTASPPGASEWSHQQQVVQSPTKETPDEDEWQEMPAYAPFDMYDDDNKLIARERADSEDEDTGYGAHGGRGYTRVTIDDDAKSATSLDENTAYLFKEPTNALDDDEEARGADEQMEATKDLLSPNERIAYVGVVRLALAEMLKDLGAIERTRGSKKELDVALESMKMLTQKLMIRLYAHMELESAEQMMIEQLTEHGLQPSDLTPTLMRNSRVKNPMKNEPSNPSTPNGDSASPSEAKIDEADSREETPDDKKSPESQSLNYKDENKDVSPNPLTAKAKEAEAEAQKRSDVSQGDETDVPPPYQEVEDNTAPELLDSADIPQTTNIDIDIRWTVLCDLFLILIADSVYDARSRDLLERVGAFLDVPALEICRFEKRVTDALEMQEGSQKEVWNEEEHIEARKKLARNKRLMYMGIATVGGGLVIGLSAGLLAPMIGAGLAAGFTTIGISGTGTFLGGAGAAAIIGTGGTAVGSAIGGKAAGRRTGHVKTFEYRPLHNNKRVNLIVTVSGWMASKVDDVRLPFSTVDPIMGDIFSVLWEPEMLTSMGDTINILATEALTQGLQQILGSTVLIALMSALQLPLVLTKLSYLIDNPWSVSMTRADAAGLILADSLIDRNLGTRPITLVGFSLGSRVIVAALRELARKGAIGLVQNVYLFGSPVVVKKDDYLRARTVVAGRFVNGYATNDWILGYLFRATGGGIARVAGLAAVEVPGIENFDVTEFVPGHMSYRTAMPRCLREVGWAVESDEFSEIEDPDPENHQARQRQLIDEIEEARKELEQQPEKKRFGFFKRNKKALVKKDWETYDERSNRVVSGEAPQAGVTDSHGGVIFDIDAIQREVLELATQGIEIKQLESTLPPMKIHSTVLDEQGAVTPRPSPRLSKDYFSRGSTSPTRSDASGSGPTADGSSRPSMQAAKSWDYDARDGASYIATGGYQNPNYHHAPHDSITSSASEAEEISMTFDTSFDSPVKASTASKSVNDLPLRQRQSLPPTPDQVQESYKKEANDNRSSTATQDSHAPLSGATGANPWDDDDEFAPKDEEEIQMSFA